MLRFRKSLVRRGKFLRQTTQRLKRGQSFLDPRRRIKRKALLVTILENFLVLVPLLFQAGLEVRISRYTIRLLESQLLLVIKLWLPF
jgi:hypothetical protein